MHEEHQAGVAEFTGNRQPLGWGHACILETLFEVDLAAAARKGGIASLGDLREDAIAAPAFREGIRFHEGIELVPGMLDAIRRQGNPHGGQIA